MRRFSIVCVICLTCVAVMEAQGVPAAQPQPPSVSKEDLEKVAERAIEAQRSADRALERAQSALDAADRRFDAVEKIFYIISLIASVFLVGVAFTEALRRRAERERFDLTLKRQDRFDELAITAATQQTKVVDNQIDLGNKVLLRSDDILQKQIDTMTKLGAVVNFVEQIFESRLKQETGREELQGKIDQLTKIVERSASDARNMLDALVVGPTLPLGDLSRMDWTSLGAEERSLAATVRLTFRNVPQATVEEAIKSSPLVIAQVCYLLGVSAYYSNDVSEALRLLSRSRELYEGVGALPAEHRFPAAFCFHFLGLIEKNWWRVSRPFEENLKDAKQYLNEAAKRLQDNPREFLTPLTLVEVLSYFEAERQNAREQLTAIFKRFEGIREGELDPNQRALRQRAFLLQGNLEILDYNVPEAISCFQNANIWFFKENSDGSRKGSDDRQENRGLRPNHFALLSMGSVGTESASRGDWLKQGLALLVESGAIEKSEATVRGTNLAWAVIAAHVLRDPRLFEFRNRFLSTMSHVRKVGDRMPLFFDPVSKLLVTSDKLTKAVKDVLMS